MERTEVKIGEPVFEVQRIESGIYCISKTTPLYLGENYFVPTDFKDRAERFQEVAYSKCYKTLEEAKTYTPVEKDCELVEGPTGYWAPRLKY